MENMYKITKKEQEKIDRGLKNNVLAKREALKADLIGIKKPEAEIEEILNANFPIIEDALALDNPYGNPNEEESTDTSAQETARLAKEAEDKAEADRVAKEEADKIAEQNAQLEAQPTARELELLRKQIELEEREKYILALQAQEEAKFNAQKEAENNAAKEAQKVEVERKAKEQEAAFEKELIEAFKGEGYNSELDAEKVAKTLMKLNKNLTSNSFSGNNNLTEKDLDNLILKRMQEQEQVRVQQEQIKAQQEFTTLQQSFIKENQDLIKDEDFVDIFNVKFEKEKSKGTSVKEAYQKAKEQTLKVLPHLSKDKPAPTKPNAKLSADLEAESARKNAAGGIAVVSTDNVASGASTTKESDDYVSYAQRLKMEQAARLRGLGK